MFGYMISEISYAVSNLQNQQVPDFGYMAFVPTILVSFVTFVQFGWMWSIGIGMRNLLPKHVSINDLWFKLCILAIALYQLYSLYLTFEAFSIYSDLHSGRNPATFLMRAISFQQYTLLMLPLTLLIIFCQGFTYYFCAKTLKSIELNKDADLGEYIGYFFLFMFNIVGFWIIQPNVNRITSGGWTPPPPVFDLVDGPDPTFAPIEPKPQHPRGDFLKTKNHEAFEHDDDFEGLF